MSRVLQKGARVAIDIVRFAGRDLTEKLSGRTGVRLARESVLSSVESSDPACHLTVSGSQLT